MILGVDHVAFSCENIESCCSELEKKGFRTEFMQQNLPNHPAKKNFLKNYCPRHAIGYCRGSSGPAIELISHGSLSQEEETPVYQPVLDKNGVRELVLNAVHYEKTTDFWQKTLNFRKESEEINTQNRQARLKFISPVPRWNLELIVTETRRVLAKAFLDDAGFTCVALLTNALGTDSEKIKRGGAVELSEEFEMQVHGKTLRIALFRGPSQELVELIQIINTDKQGNKNGATNR